MGYYCKWCKKQHETMHDCPRTKEILPADTPFQPAVFGRLMKFLFLPTDEELEQARIGYTKDGQKSVFLKVCNLCMRADETLAVMSGFDENGACERCGNEGVKLALVKCTRED